MKRLSLIAAIVMVAGVGLGCGWTCKSCLASWSCAILGCRGGVVEKDGCGACDPTTWFVYDERGELLSEWTPKGVGDLVIGQNQATNVNIPSADYPILIGHTLPTNLSLGDFILEATEITMYDDDGMEEWSITMPQDSDATNATQAAMWILEHNGLTSNVVAALVESGEVCKVLGHKKKYVGACEMIGCLVIHANIDRWRCTICNKTWVKKEEWVEE